MASVLPVKPSLWTQTLFFLFLYFWLLVFPGRVSLCSPGCPETCSVDQAGLEPIDLLLLPECWDNSSVATRVLVHEGEIVPALIELTVLGNRVDR